MQAGNWREDPNAYTHHGTLQPRITDVDTERHINNVAVQKLHEEARARFLAQALGAPVLAPRDHGFWTMSADTDYLQIAYYPESITYGVCLTGLDAYGYTVATALFQDGRCIGTQRARIAAWADGQAVPLSASVRAALHPFIQPSSDSQSDWLCAEAVELDAFPFNVDVTLRYGDVDADGYLSQTAISRFLEEARMSILKAVWGRHGADMARAPDGIVIARVSAQNLHSSVSRLPVRVASGVTRVGNASFVIRAAIKDKNHCIAVGDTVAVRMNRATGRSCILDGSQRLALERCLIAPI